MDPRANENVPSFYSTLVIIYIVYNFLHFNVKKQVGKFIAISKFEIFVHRKNPTKSV